MNNLKKKKIVIHNDFTNFLINTEKADDPLNLEKAARRELLSKADIISLAVGVNQGNCYYYPTKAGGIIGADGKKDIHGGAVMRALTASGIDPYGLVLDQLHRDGCTVLAKLRVNDCHHVAGHTALQSKFWMEHPEWRIGTIEKRGGGEISFDSTPCVGPEYHKMIVRTRGLLLDYALPEVFEYRLSLVREFMERYDVDGLTLNFLRNEFCISFPSKNAPILTDFVAACRRIVNEAVGKRGRSDPIMGAIVPWDPD